MAQNGYPVYALDYIYVKDNIIGMEKSETITTEPCTQFHFY